MSFRETRPWNVNRTIYIRAFYSAFYLFDSLSSLGFLFVNFYLFTAACIQKSPPFFFNNLCRQITSIGGGGGMTDGVEFDVFRSMDVLRK